MVRGLEDEAEEGGGSNLSHLLKGSERNGKWSRTGMVSIEVVTVSERGDDDGFVCHSRQEKETCVHQEVEVKGIAMKM